MTELERAPFLAACEIIDWQSVSALATRVRADQQGVAAVAALFSWVRDAIAHTGDAGQGKLTLRASEVAREGTGLCYAKSHLLVALLRASGVPAGLCYQRLSTSDAAASFVLHGLVAVLLPDQRFVRIDPRGNKPGIDVRFVPGLEALAFSPSSPGEADLPGVFARPIPEVVAALAVGGVWHPEQTALPDVAPQDWPATDAQWHTPSEPLLP